MTTQMNATYINALLADASYVELTNPDGSIASPRRADEFTLSAV
jgi:hypothetical protein